MSNFAIAAPNDVDTCTLAGGYWSTVYPRSKLQTRERADFARTGNALANSTYIDFTTPNSDSLVGLVALIGHNLSTAATSRLRGYSSQPGGYVDLDFTGTVTESRVTNNRSGSATYIDSAGVLQTAAANTLRPYYSPGTSTLLGLLNEAGTTNYLLRSRDLSNAAWTKTNMTAALTSTGLDGTATSATRLTATSGNGTVTQAIVQASELKCFSVWIKRITGSGNIDLTLDNGSTWTTKAITTSWTRISITQTLANQTCGIRVVTSGDAVDVDFTQNELHGYATSAIATTTVGVARVSDRYSITIPTVYVNSIVGTINIEFQTFGAPRVSAAGLYSVQTDGSNHMTHSLDTSLSATFSVVNGGATQVSAIDAFTVTANTTTRVCSAWQVNNFVTCHDGGTVATDVSGTVPAWTQVFLGANAGGNPFDGYIARASIHNVRLADADVDSSSSSAWTTVPSTYDTGTVDVYPAAYLAGTTTAQRASMRAELKHILTSNQTIRYWRLQVTDTANSAGYLQFARLFVGQCFTPTYNAAYGAGIWYEGQDGVSRMPIGVEFFRVNYRPRKVHFSLDWVTDAEAYGQVMEMERVCGNSGEVFFCYDPADTLQAPRRSFLARMEKCGPLKQIFSGMNSVEYELVELV